MRYQPQRLTIIASMIYLINSKILFFLKSFLQKSTNPQCSYHIFLKLVEICQNKKSKLSIRVG